MENLVLEGSAKTPAIDFNAGNGKLEFRGRSIPENSIEFFKPLNDWLDGYAQSSPNAIDVHVRLEYFNTSSSKCILDFFKRLEGIKNGGSSDVNVTWYFEEDDEDMQEAGEDYQAIVNLPFNIIEVEEI